MVSHFLLCVSPTIVFTANTDLSSSLPSDLNQWIYKAETYNFALYLASYFFSSSFTLFKMLPKRIAVVNVTSGRKNTRTAHIRCHLEASNTSCLRLSEMNSTLLTLLVLLFFVISLIAAQCIPCNTGADCGWGLWCYSGCCDSAAGIGK
ncbi:hypothetical protein QR680_018432 [Steinernema hermaphroditum]|uniref:Uncharacterized protein n=1 Tax=Steinernema hermaphroditum TaxID=289476 RepID=A0AA39LR37_9BILA|nr:hypothetical protein QR680_018432 [Steinernema hermaphroditum]